MKTTDGSRWVDLDDIEREQLAKPRSASPVRQTLEHILALVEELQGAREMQEHRIETLEQQVAVLHRHSSHEPVPMLQGIAGKLARRNLR